MMESGINQFFFQKFFKKAQFVAKSIHIPKQTWYSLILTLKFCIEAIQVSARNANSLRNSRSRSCPSKSARVRFNIITQKYGNFIPQRKQIVPNILLHLTILPRNAEVSPPYVAFIYSKNARNLR